MPMTLARTVRLAVNLGVLAGAASCARSARDLPPDPLQHVTATQVGSARPFEAGRLDEASGLALAVGDAVRFWVLNDSGNPAELFLVDSMAATLQCVPIRGAVNRDWEDLSAGPCPRGRCLYIGDIGDNGARRAFVTVYRLPEPGTDSVVLRQ